MPSFTAFTVDLPKGSQWVQGGRGCFDHQVGLVAQKMQVQPTAMVSMTTRWRQGPGRGDGGQRRRRTGTWLNTGTLTMLRSSCMVKGFTQPRHRQRASGKSAGMRLGSWLMLQGARERAGRREEGERHQEQPRAHPCQTQGVLRGQD